MDIAALGLSVDSGPAERAVAALRQLPGAARAAAAGADQIAGSAEREARAMTQSTAAINTNARAAQVAGSAMRAANQNIASSGGLARHELVNLSRQVQDIGVSLSSGQSPFTVLVQQGTQVGDIFANTNGTLRGFASQIASMITPMRLLGVGFVVVGAAAYAGISYWKSYALALDDLSHITGTATAELSRLQTAASIKGIGQDDFAGGMRRFADAVYDAKAGTNDLATLLRLNGKTVSDTAGTLDTVAELVRRAKDDQQRLQILQQAGLPATMEWVRLLRNGSEGLQAAKDEAAKFGGVVNDQMVAKAREFDEAWNRAWTNFGVSMRRTIVEGYDLLQRLIEKGREAVGAFDRATGGQGLSTVGANLLKSGLGTPLSQDTGQLYGGLMAGPKGAGDAGGVRDAAWLAQQQRAIQLEQQRISLLGEAATAADHRREVELRLQAAQLAGVSLTEQQIEKIKRYAQEERSLAETQKTLSVLGASATEAERYAARIQELGVALNRGDISQEQFNRAVRDASPIFQTLRDSAVSFTQDLVAGLMQGKSLMESLGSSAIKLGNALVSGGINQIAQGNIVTGGLMIGGGFLANMFGQNQQKKEQEQQAQQQLLQQQQQAAAEAARIAQQQADAAANYRYQAASLGIDTSSYAGAFAKLELDIQHDRAEAAKVGGVAITAYEQLAQAKRYALEKEWAEKIAAVRLSYEDRIFAATNDNSTLAGKLAEYDRKAAQERVDAIKTYGQVYVELEQAQAAERGKIIKDALKEQTDYYDSLRKTISDFTSGLQFGNLSTLSPAEQFLAARNQFQTQYGLAIGGDRTAQGGITGVAQTLLEQARNYLGPSVEYGSLVDRITQQLGALPDIAMAADPQVQELQRIGDSGMQTVDQLTAISRQLQQTQAENRALQQQVASLIANGNQQSARIVELTDKLRLELRQGLEAIKIRAA